MTAVMPLNQTPMPKRPSQKLYKQHVNISAIRFGPPRSHLLSTDVSDALRPFHARSHAYARLSRLLLPLRWALSLPDLKRLLYIHVSGLLISVHF